MRLPHTCTIQKSAAGTADAYGEPARVWSTDAAGVSCRFYYGQGEALDPDTSGVVKRDILSALFAGGTTIDATRRITTVQAGYAGTYVVSGIRARSDGRGTIHHYEVTLTEVST
jgi:hypothetical protein